MEEPQSGELFDLRFSNQKLKAENQRLRDDLNKAQDHNISLNERLSSEINHLRELLATLANDLDVANKQLIMLVEAHSPDPDAWNQYHLRYEEDIKQARAALEGKE